ncbi:hypothetical protein RRG08_040838 [Elysia crispata]|uniref:Uncharacterized protein n=1 Tax=Elysia crispata TaxID=231223 RepID=A0AAE1AGL7_9GAST|nr:hypothetical protein RRG08_040838 [Elysia crispata]
MVLRLKGLVGRDLFRALVMMQISLTYKSQEAKRCNVFPNHRAMPVTSQAAGITDGQEDGDVCPGPGVWVKEQTEEVSISLPYRIRLMQTPPDAESWVLFLVRADSSRLDSENFPVYRLIGPRVH